MRAVLQRVHSASVAVEGVDIARISTGVLLFAGFELADQTADLAWMAKKICRLRVFADESGLMNRSLQDTGGELLLVSQFTLFASVRKGHRPSWSRAAPGAISQPLFAEFGRLVEAELGRPIARGQFGADMQVSLINDGPVTLTIDSRQTV